MQILRHSKIAVAMEVYAEVVSASTKDALRRLGEQPDPATRHDAAERACRAVAVTPRRLE